MTQGQVTVAVYNDYLISMINAKKPRQITQMSYITLLSSTNVHYILGSTKIIHF